MNTAIGVRFKPVGKITYFLAPNAPIHEQDWVVVSTDQGTECGQIALIKPAYQGETPPKILRFATAKDLQTLTENKEKAHAALQVFQEKIQSHGLDMKPCEVEFAFDHSKITFFFTADGRIDFRELVKDLAYTYRNRIELRQIGVRDQAKALGGIAICGQKFCCSRFLGDFHPVSIKMAKEQNLSLNPIKLSGSCGRLMCCLKYEQESYEHLVKTTPPIHASVETPDGMGTVVDVNLLSGLLKVKMDSKDILMPKFFDKNDVKVSGKKTESPNKKKKA